MAAPHLPVLLEPLLRAVSPVSGLWVDGTFGAGGYARGLLAAGADRVIGIDRDPSVFPMAAACSPTPRHACATSCARLRLQPPIWPMRI